jgi:hypothetical protein
MVQLRGGFTATDERLGRLPEFDERSRAFAVSDVLDMAKPLRSKTWALKLLLDQLRTSGCTGHSRTYDLAAAPLPLTKPGGEPFDFDFADALYQLAKFYDPWPGEDYEGSSVLGACKALAKLGFIGEYRWAFSARDLWLALGYKGPVVLGTDWLNSMFDPKPNGLLTVDPQSGSAGGHAYCATGIYVTKTAKRKWLGPNEVLKDEPLITGPNSWGQWGKNGYWAMWASDVEILRKGVESKGEASICTVPFRRKRSD